MKNPNVFIILGLVAALLIVAYYGGRENGYDKATEEYSSTISLMQAEYAKAPDTVKVVDTIWSEKDVYIDRYTPKPVEVQGDTILYSDTIRTDDLDFWIRDKTGSVIFSRETGYTLKVPKIITDSVTIYKNVPVLIENTCKTHLQNKAYITAGVGLGYYHIGYGQIFKERHALGANMVMYKNSPNVVLNYTYFLGKR